MKSNVSVPVASFLANFSAPSYRINSITAAFANVLLFSAYDLNFGTHRTTGFHVGLEISTHVVTGDFPGTFPCFLCRKPSYFFVGVYKRSTQSAGYDSTYVAATPPLRSIELQSLTGAAEQLREVRWHTPAVRFSHNHGGGNYAHPWSIIWPLVRRTPSYLYFWTIIKAAADSKFTFRSTMFPFLQGGVYQDNNTLFEFHRVNDPAFLDSVRPSA